MFRNFKHLTPKDARLIVWLRCQNIFFRRFFLGALAHVGGTPAVRQSVVFLPKLGDGLKNFEICPQKKIAFLNWILGPGFKVAGKRGTGF